MASAEQIHEHSPTVLQTVPTNLEEREGQCVSQTLYRHKLQSVPAVPPCLGLQPIRLFGMVLQRHGKTSFSGVPNPWGRTPTHRRPKGMRPPCTHSTNSAGSALQPRTLKVFIRDLCPACSLDAVAEVPSYTAQGRTRDPHVQQAAASSPSQLWGAHLTEGRKGECDQGMLTRKGLRRNHKKSKKHQERFCSALSIPQGLPILQKTEDFRKLYFLPSLAMPVGIYQRGSRGFCGFLKVP